MACDAQTLENLLVADGLPSLSERDALICLAYIYGVSAQMNAQQAVTLAATYGLAKLSDADLDKAFLASIC